MSRLKAIEDKALPTQYHLYRMTPSQERTLRVRKTHESSTESAQTDKVLLLLRQRYNDAIKAPCQQTPSTCSRPGLNAKPGCARKNMLTKSAAVKSPATTTRNPSATCRSPRSACPETPDWGELLSFLMRENLPGYYPYTAGVFPYRRTGEDPIRMFAGEGTPERTNRRFHLLAYGQPAVRSAPHSTR